MVWVIELAVSVLSVPNHGSVHTSAKVSRRSNGCTLLRRQLKRCWKLLMARRPGLACYVPGIGKISLLSSTDFLNEAYRISIHLLVELTKKRMTRRLIYICNTDLESGYCFWNRCSCQAVELDSLKFKQL